MCTTGREGPRAIARGAPNHRRVVFFVTSLPAGSVTRGLSRWTPTAEIVATAGATVRAADACSVEAEVDALTVALGLPVNPIFST